MDAAIRCHELFTHLGDEDLLVVDCRDPDHWSRIGLHIPGALRMTLDEVLQYADSFPDDELIVLCGDRSVQRECGRVGRLLRLQGLDVVCLEGGMDQWLLAGFPTEPHECFDEPRI